MARPSTATPNALRVLLVAASIVTVVPRAMAQTAPLPGVSIGDPNGFLTRAAWFLGVARLESGDPRFSEVARTRVDVDLVHYPRGRVNQFFDAEFVMGSEHRAFDFNHDNIIFETSASCRVASIDFAGVFHHTSRHLIDRAFDRVVAWHTVAARGERVFAGRQSMVAVTVEYARVTQRTFVDYEWTSQATVRFDRALGRRAHLVASASGGSVGVDADVVGRGRQDGSRVEGGVHVTGQRAGVDLFAAYERRVDGFPTSRVPASWFEAGFRLSSF